MADAPVMATYGVEASTKRRSSSPEAKSPLSSECSSFPDC